MTLPAQQKPADPPKLPTLQELIDDTDMSIKTNNLMVLVNQPPPESWLKEHPFAKVKNAENKNVPAKYITVERVEYLLNRIYGRFWTEIKEFKVLANSVTISLRLYVKNPVTGEVEWNDGIGAAVIQTDEGAAATDFSKVKSAGVMMAAPAAKTYALKDAAEGFGKLFGKDLNRRDNLSYDSLIKEKIVYDWEDLQTLYELKKEAIPVGEIESINRIIRDKEKTSYSKLHNFLKSL